MIQSRRGFVRSVVALAGAAFAAGRAPGDDTAPSSDDGAAGGWQLPGEVRITAITSTRYPVRHPRKIGRNSRRDHGEGHQDPLVRVQTDAGIEGIGTACHPQLLGKTLGEILEVRGGRLSIRETMRPLVPPTSQGVLVDLVGKLTQRPAADLLGMIIRRSVPCYDGSIYMRELDAGDAAIADDTQYGLDAGHTAFKIKIGRGNWLGDRDRGYARDLWAINRVRATAGQQATLMVDANNYYLPHEARRLVDDTAGIGLYWLEEMFDETDPANHEDYRALRAAIVKHELPTLLADGETGDGSGVLLDLIEEGTVQVAQPDTYRVGFLSYLDYARQVGDRGGLIGPHTWANRIKVVETCLLGMVVPNFTMVEDCCLDGDVVQLPHCHIDGGRMKLDDVPGIGLVIDEAAYKRFSAASAKTLQWPSGSVSGA